MNNQLMDFLNRYGYWIYILIFVAIFYLTLIRPQQRRQKKHKQLTDSLEVDDKVVTIGGVYGTIKRIYEDKILITVGPKFDIEFTKNAVIRKISK